MNSQTNFSSVHATANERGGVMLSVLIFIVVLSMVFVAVLSRTMNTYRHVSQVASWQEALVAAEAASDGAMVELRKTLSNPANAFSGWTKTAANGTPLPNGEMRFTFPRLEHGGEGNTALDRTVVIDAPPELLDGSARQWYRIRSTGTTYLPGAAHLTANKSDHLLRRLSFLWDRKTKQQVTRPQSSRLVEILVRPTSFENAITSNQPIRLNNFKIDVDSYDSRDATKSTNGLYDVAKRQQNGDIATNSQLIEAGNADIFGDAYTNAGVITNGANITGEQRNDFYQELLPVTTPTWVAVPVVPNTINSDMTLIGGPKANPIRYKVDQINLPSRILTVAASAPGVESYVEIWVTGHLNASGNGSIVLQPNANLKIFIEGNIDVTGNGTFNANSQPSRLQMLGLKPPAGQTRSIALSGNGAIAAAIYAPNHDVTYGGGGSGGTYWGSLVGQSITMGGNSVVHYDEALSDSGHITDFKIKSWFEDNK